MEASKSFEETAMEQAMQFNEQYHEQRPDCRVRFEQIMSKQTEHDKEFRAHREFRESTGTDLATLSTKMDAQSNSLDALARSIAGTNKIMLGLLVTVLMTLFGFFIDYVSKLIP
jgi:ferric-dicitrate binding protein FerR (iron transport regulator)